VAELGRALPDDAWAGVPLLGTLVLKGNLLRQLPPLPPALVKLSAANNKLAELPPLPASLRELREHL